MKKIFQIILILLIVYVCIYPKWFMKKIFQLDNIKLTKISETFDKKNQSFAFLIESDQIPMGISGIKASDCGKCHQKIYNEWKQTTHAQALEDIQFQAEISKADNPKWLCLNCHIPLKNQRKNIVIGLKNKNILNPLFKKNLNFDKELQQEAITCAVCHLVKTKNNKAAILGPRGSKLAPHPVVKDKVRLRGVCMRCHQPEGKSLTPNLLCWFHPKDEMILNKEKKQDCVSCHMPLVDRKISILSLEKKLSHSHHWVGSAIPKNFLGYNTLKNRGFKPSVSGSLRLKENIILLKIKNKNSGHHLPSGDPERYVALILSIKNKEGIITKYVSRIGQTWQWNPAKKIGDNRMIPFEERNFYINISQSDSFYSYEIWNVRLNAQNATYMKESKNLDESLIKGINHQVALLDSLYPLATLLYKEDNLNEKKKVYQISELIQISKQESKIDIKDRSYANLETFKKLIEIKND
ncbi:MAG: hypothetical protein COB02_06110 [Candidatus Cloacimonadota bacterium]|nr:MAG: hypothetical protein COB02_06110 [Candidatus Cloacimonadota bacterium]